MKHEIMKVDRTSGGNVVVGQVSGFGVDGAPEVCFGEPAGDPAPALTTIMLGADDIGAKVALSFIEGDPRRPIIIGRVLGPSTARAANVGLSGEAPDGRLKSELLEITSPTELTLRCGKASITLTRSGKIILRGTYISSRSSGVIRIKGGSVQIN